MARLWIAYRDGLALRGYAFATLPFEQAVTKLDVATWRRFADDPPTEVAAELVERQPGRHRVLVEVGTGDRESLSAFSVGLYESPFSPAEAKRRLQLS